MPCTKTGAAIAAHLPHNDRAILDIRKIEDYCLSSSHPCGRHKARVLREALGLRRKDAAWLRGVLLEAARSSEALQLPSDGWGTRWRLDVTVRRHRKKRCGKNVMDCADRRERAEVRHLLGALMKAKKKRARSEEPSLLDVVALLTELPEDGLGRGQVGTVVEQLDERTFLVEFSDAKGRAYAVVPCPRAALVVLHYVPEAA